MFRLYPRGGATLAVALTLVGCRVCEHASLANGHDALFVTWTTTAELNGDRFEIELASLTGGTVSAFAKTVSTPACAISRGRSAQRPPAFAAMTSLLAQRSSPESNPPT